LKSIAVCDANGKYIASPSKIRNKFQVTESWQVIEIARDIQFYARERGVM
jgi:hypothetical protein